MTPKKLLSTLLLIILSAITSCIGQDNTIENKTQDVTSIQGELATELDNNIWKIFQDKHGNYWFGTNGQGVLKYDGKKLKRYTSKDGLVDNSIRSIKGDHKGNVYIGTPKGVSIYDGVTFKTLEPIVSSSNEWKLEPNDLWFNCNGNNLYRYDGEKMYELVLPTKDLNKAFDSNVQGVSFTDMNNSPYAVYGINKDKSGNLWLGTVSAGAFRYDGTSFLWIPEKELSTLPDGRVPGVRSMLEDKNGYMWLSNFKSKYNITNNDSIAEYEKLEGVAKSSGYFNDRLPYFNAGITDNESNLWMTTYTGGVWKYDGEDLFNFPMDDGENELLLISIYKDNEGVLWLGSDNAGVYKHNGKMFEKFVPFLEQNK